MIIFKKAALLSDYLKKQQARGKTVGFVPTMGALHQGHLSLIHTCLENNDITVCSIFVNPTQFNNPDDFLKYPNTISKDIEALTRTGVSILFLPSEAEIYPAGHIKKNYNLGTLEHVLEGKFRPGHFQGVCEVMERLLTITGPDKLYMGKKDYQQCLVINRLVQQLQLSIQLNFLPTLREADGLAMSSRNLRLTPDLRSHAHDVYVTLTWIKENFPKESIQTLESEGIRMLTSRGWKVDYCAIADASTLEPATNGKPAVALVAAYIDGVRLIDNLPLN